MAYGKYEMNPAGLREIGRSSGVQSAALAAGAAVAATARAINPTGDYEVTPRTVSAGWQREDRAGAQVTEVAAGRGPQRRALARAASQRRGR